MTVEAYAKVNLTLEVLGLRPDGYHDLRSVVLPTTLADTIELEPADAVSSDYRCDYLEDLQSHHVLLHPPVLRPL